MGGEKEAYTYLEVAVGVDEEVGRLQIAVQDVGGVHVLEGTEDLQGVGGGRVEWWVGLGWVGLNKTQHSMKPTYPNPWLTVAHSNRLILYV